MGFLRTLATFLLCLTLTGTAYAFDPCTKWQTISEVRGDTLTIHWVGPIKDDIDQRIALLFDYHRYRIKVVRLSLSSCGGTDTAIERTIKVLRRVKQTHELMTVVRHGDLCASACVDIFLEGSRRIAGLSSSWLFHEPIERQAAEQNGLAITDAEWTERMIAEYTAAGVSRRWLKRMRKEIKGADWWQTGRDLWEDQSGIITEVMNNRVPRNTTEVTVGTTCTFCRDPRISYGQEPTPEHLPDPMDMLGLPRSQ